MKLIVLHITDLHLYRRLTFLDEKIDSIKNIVNNDDFSNNVLILFTGDAVQSGLKEDYEVFSNFINEIKAKIKKKIRIAICPGNHDRKFNEETIDSEYVKSIKDSNFDEKINELMYLNDNYNDFVNTNFESKSQINNVLLKFNFTYDNNKVSVYSLNNSLLSAYSSPEGDDAANIGNIYIAPDHLKIERENETLSFLIMHIPFSYLRKETKGKLSQIVSNNIDVVFTGHTHEDSIVANSAGYIELTAPALYSDGQSGFTLFHIDNNKMYYQLYLFNENDYVYEEINDNGINAIDFKRKEATKDKLRVNLKQVDQNNFVKFGHTSTDISNIFVFPNLTEKKYLNFEKKKITTFDKFVEAIKKKKIVIIKGDDESGKSVLANRLFHLFVSRGFNPLITSGNNFTKVSTNKSAKLLMSSIIKDNYNNQSAEQLYWNTEEKSRILIIDDSDVADFKRIMDSTTLFGNIILMSNSHVCDFFSNDEALNDNVLVLAIDVLYKAKRDEFLQLIYNTAAKIKPDILENFKKDTFITTFDKVIEKMDKMNSIDPKSILDLSTSMLFDVDVHNVDKNWSHQKTKYDSKLDLIEKDKSFANCGRFNSIRMLGDMAYDCYMKKHNSFSKDDFCDVYDREIALYDPPFDQKKIELYLSKLIDLDILKKNEDFSYSFINRKIFAYFISEYIVNCLHNKHSKIEIEVVLSRGLYSSLNSYILLNISNNYNYDDILDFFTNDLYNKISGAKLELKDFSSISKYFESERKRIELLDENRISEIKQDISKAEQIQRENYLEHSDDFFYEKDASETMKEMIDLLNKSQVVSNLLNSAPSKLTKGIKDKLTSIALTLPNIVVDKYITITNDDLEKMYVQMQREQSNNKKYSTKFISRFFDLLLSYVTATVLSIYDVGSRPLDNPMLNERLCERLRDDANPVKDIQRFMIMSFSARENQFIDSVINYIDNKNNTEFNKNCVRLIARRYCIENYDSLIENKKKYFIDKISNNNSIGVLLEHSKKKF